MHWRDSPGQRSFQDRRSGLLARGLIAAVLLVAGCTSPVGSAETSAAAQPTTSSMSPSATPTSASSTSSPMPTSASVGVARTATPREFGAAVCYYSADLDKPDNSSSIAFGFKDGEDNVISAEDLVDACHDSLVRGGKINQADSVAACVLQDGQIGVVPGTDGICATLNLPMVDLAASAPLPSPSR
jgi:hypothetical protein